MSETWQRRLALALAGTAFALALAALIVALARRGDSPSREVARAAAPAPARSRAEDDDAIRKLDATHYEITRTAVDDALADPSQLARVVPAPNGTGFRLFGVRPGGLLFRVGLENGDLIRGVNGMDVSTPASALQVYQQLRSANRFTIDLDRRGSPLQITITIR